MQSANKDINSLLVSYVLLKQQLVVARDTVSKRRTRLLAQLTVQSS